MQSLRSMRKVSQNGVYRSQICCCRASVTKQIAHLLKKIQVFCETRKFTIEFEEPATGAPHKPTISSLHPAIVSTKDQFL